MPKTLNQFLSRPLIFTLKLGDYRLVVLQTVPQCGFVSLWFHRSSVSLAERSQKWHVLRKTCSSTSGWWPNQRFFCFIFRWNLGKTYNIVLGFGQVVLGMDMGLREMCVGEKRTVIIPPHLGYGEAGVGESVVEKASGTWSLFVFCAFWCSNTICFFHLKPQPRKAVVFIQVFSIFISKPHEFGVSAMLMGLSRGFCGRKKNKKPLTLQTHVWEMSLKGLPRWARRFLGKLFPGTVECYLRSYLRRFPCGKDWCQVLEILVVFALTAIMVWFMILAKMNPPHGVWREPLLFQFLYFCCLEME